jgi:GT2 family glycosyltransferase
VAQHCPIVSIAIPLYRSAPWVENIAANIANLDYPSVEIIISDRHCTDTALSQLEQRFANDPRIRFLSSTDQLNWVEHYNLLLRQATGTYFLWMPHDDVYSAGYLPSLVDALDADPAAVLAYGRMDVKAPDESNLRAQQLRLPHGASAKWSPRHAGRLFAPGNNAGIAFRGLFRRDVVVRSGLYIRPTSGCVLADVYWLLALALLGPFKHVPTCSCTKRYHSSSAHSQWRYTRKARIEGLRVVRSYLRDHCPSARDRAAVGCHFLLWTLRRMLDPLRELR